MTGAFVKKHELSSFPFASQFDEIDKALFEYTYSKQTHQYPHQKPHKRSTYIDDNNNNNNSSKTKIGVTPNSTGLHKNSRAQKYYQYRGHPLNTAPTSYVNGLAHSMIQGIATNQVTSLNSAPQSLAPGHKNSLDVSNPSGSTYYGFSQRGDNYVFGGDSSSPVNFVDDLMGNGMSTSLTSSGSSSIDTFNLEHGVISQSKGLFDNQMSSPQFEGFHGFEKSKINGIYDTMADSKSELLGSNHTFNNVTGFSNDHGFNDLKFKVDGINNDVNHRSGWLNIWGNDMSVWA